MTDKEYTAWLNREYLKQEPWAELTGKTWADMAKDKPWFKAACRRTVNGLVAKPKRFRVPIPARRGLNSILGEYTTGRNVKVTRYKGRRDQYFGSDVVGAELASSTLSASRPAS